MARSATLLKKRLWHRCFPVNFSKLLRTPFTQNCEKLKNCEATASLQWKQTDIRLTKEDETKWYYKFFPTIVNENHSLESISSQNTPIKNTPIENTPIKNTVKQPLGKNHIQCLLTNSRLVSLESSKLTGKTPEWRLLVSIWCLYWLLWTYLPY